jgi:adenylate kinase
MTAPVVIGVFGISGVGKSRLIGEVAARIPGSLHLQGSALIKQGLADPTVSSEELRLASGDRIIARQRILIAMFNRAIAKHPSSLVLFDGHLLIDTETELIEVPQAVIAALRLAVLVHVEGDASLIAARRNADTERIRPVRDIDTLSAHQARSQRLCQDCVLRLGVPIRIVGSGDVGGFAELCR